MYWRFIQNHLRTLSKNYLKNCKGISFFSSFLCSVKGKAYSRTAKNCPILYFLFFAVLEYALSFTEFLRKNDDNRSGLDFENANSQWKYLFESRHSRTKTYSRTAKIPKFFKIFLWYFFTFTVKKLSLAIGQKRSILKIQNHPRSLFRPCSINIYQK